MPLASTDAVRAGALRGFSVVGKGQGPARFTAIVSCVIAADRVVLWWIL